MLARTPLHERTSALCESWAWRRWAGYAVCGSYDMSHEREYHAIRNSAALLDVSPLYKYRISGRDAAWLLDRVLVRDVINSKVGQVMYTPWCDAQGKVIDDGTVSRLEESVFRLTSAEPSMRWLHLNAAGMQVTIEDVSGQTAALALQGPNARHVLEAATGSDLGGLRYFRVTSARMGTVPVTVSRTGYTGDLGYEIWMDADRALDVWDTLVAAGSPWGITPTGILALDIARIEAGLILLDVDYVSAHKALIANQLSSPYELNLGWAVALGKEWFVGKAALAAEQRRAAEWRLVGLEVNWDSLERLYGAVGLPPRLPAVAWRVSVPVYSGSAQIGYATSGCWSPLLKKYIALAHLRMPYGAAGTEVDMEVTVEHHRRRAAARVTTLPFFDPPRKRA